MVFRFFFQGSPVPRCITLFGRTDGKDIQAPPLCCSDFCFYYLPLLASHWLFYRLSIFSTPRRCICDFTFCCTDWCYRCHCLFLSKLERTGVDSFYCFTESSLPYRV